MILPADGRVIAPTLPAVEGREWSEQTRAWWEGIFASPVGHELIGADTFGLLRLAVLVDDFGKADTPGDRVRLASEIRLASQCYGLDPVSRRRLGWTVTAPKQESAVQHYLRGRDGAEDEKDPRDYWRNPSPKAT